MYTVLLATLPVSPMPEIFAPVSFWMQWSTQRIMFALGAKREYASTSLRACETDSWPKGQRIFFSAKSSEVDVSWTR